jgi:menaquinone-dependent protoporphyrinogen IX oxidase
MNIATFANRRKGALEFTSSAFTAITVLYRPTKLQKERNTVIYDCVQVPPWPTLLCCDESCFDWRHNVLQMKK